MGRQISGDTKDPTAQIRARNTDNDLYSKDTFPIRPLSLPERLINAETCRIYGYGHVKHGTDDLAQAAEYKNQKSEVVARHIRYNGKNFAWTFLSQKKEDQEIRKLQLFGQHLGSSGTLIITEGEIDAMSVYEALANYAIIGKSCVVSIASGTGSVEQLASNLSWVLGFSKVIIFFDQDEPGEKAATRAAEIVGPKAAIVSGFAYKDANEAWVNKDSTAIRQALQRAKKYRPVSIVPAIDLLDRLLNPDKTKGHPFPWKGWNDMAKKGMQPGELWMISGGTGIGKSLFTRSMCVHLAMKNVRCAYIGLEESMDTTLERMVSEVMATNYYLTEGIERNALKDRATEAFNLIAPNIFLMDRFGGDSFDVFISNVRHYVLSEECQVVFLDHFSLLADGIALGTDQRRAIDKCIKELKTMAVELKFTFVCVCHLSRDHNASRSAEEGGEPNLAQLRGSHSLAQIPDYIVMLQRNPNSEEADKNQTTCWLKKNRVNGEIGRMSTIEFNQANYSLLQVTPHGF